MAIVGNMPRYEPNINIVDIVEWTLTPNKQFTIKSAWNVMGTQYHVVWHKDYLSRCNFILWLMCRNGINAGIN